MEVLWVVILYAILFTLIISVGLEGERDYRGIGLFFLLMFLPLWVLALIVQPFGPTYEGIAWFDLFIFALIISLFIGAATPPYYYRMRRSAGTIIESDRLEGNRSIVRGTSIFFWLFALLLIISIVALI